MEEATRVSGAVTREKLALLSLGPTGVLGGRNGRMRSEHQPYAFVAPLEGSEEATGYGKG